MATPPRRVLPGAIYEVSRRTIFRQFLLLPTHKAVELFKYILAVVADRYNITLFAAVVMFNHYHLLLRDNDGRLPDFMRDFDALLARAMNAYLGKDDAFWSADGYVPLEPLSDEAIDERMRYILGNPLAANLVNRLEDFPGFILEPDMIGRPIEVRRPDVFFGPRTKLPEVVTLTFHAPPHLEHLDNGELQQHLAQEIDALERKHRRRRKAAGESVIGRRRLMNVSWEDKPKSRESWFTLRPRFAEKRRSIRVAAIRELKAFRAQYREARQRYLDGDRDAVFPAGTWALRRELGVAVDLAAG